MHGKHGYAHIHGVDVHLGDVLRNRSAAAEVNSSELARLPYNVLFCEHASHICDIFGGCVVRTALASCSGKLVHGHALVDVANVHLLECGCKRGVVSCGDVCRDAL